MFIELNYDGSLGSICPFCGYHVSVDWTKKTVVVYPENTTKYNLFQCCCPNGHISFVKSYLHEDPDNYEVRIMMCVFEQDWLDHVGHMQLENYGKIDQFYTEVMQEEDTLWRIIKAKSPRHPFCQGNNQLRPPNPYRLKEVKEEMGQL